MPVYNKLVRDRIPEIIEESGKKCHFRVLEDQEYLKELQKKLREEMDEYFSCQTDEEALEELADILEIIHALTTYHGYSVKELEEVRLQKAQARGGFKKKIFLVQVED